MTENEKNKLIENVDNLIVEGIKRKGYIFDNESDLRDFIKNNCSIKSTGKFFDMIYLVKGLPFMQVTHVMEEGEEDIECNVKYEFL